MAKEKTKKMTLTYWKGLSEGTKKRALTYVFPTQPACVNMLLNEKPNVKQSHWWQMVWKTVSIPTDQSHYKVVINKETFIC